MKSIDFLPEIYRQREALRRAQWWWAAVGLLFGVVIGASALAQGWLRHRLVSEFDGLAKECAAAQAQVQELASLQAQIQRASHEASLYTFLDSPWPRSQLLRTVVQPLPESIRLLQIHIVEEEQAKAAVQAGPRPSKADDQSAKPTSAETDLVRVMEDAQRRQTTIEIEGYTLDVSRLHDYMADVGRSPLVASIQPKSLEAAPAGHSGQTKFTLRLVVRPGYGIKGSDNLPTEAAASAPPPERRMNAGGAG